MVSPQIVGTGTTLPALAEVRGHARRSRPQSPAGPAQPPHPRGASRVCQKFLSGRPRELSALFWLAWPARHGWDRWPAQWRPRPAQLRRECLPALVLLQDRPRSPSPVHGRPHAAVALARGDTPSEITNTL